jgi:hypothetical protein
MRKGREATRSKQDACGAVAAQRGWEAGGVRPAGSGLAAWRGVGCRAAEGKVEEAGPTHMSTTAIWERVARASSTAAI